MTNKQLGVLSFPVIVAALGYFVDIYDLLLFSIIRIPSLRSLGLNDSQIAKQGLFIINIQMIGLLVGGIIWGILGDKKGRLKVLYASIILYSIGNIANGFVHTVDQYALVRFITGIGLAGELGAGITLVSELLPKEKRGIGTSMVAGIGLTGAVFAFFLKQHFVQPDNTGWRICYFIGGGLGFVLLLLRIGVLESGMFKSIQNVKISKGYFLYYHCNKHDLVFQFTRSNCKYTLHCKCIAWFWNGLLGNFCNDGCRTVWYQYQSNCCNNSSQHGTRFTYACNVVIYTIAKKC